MADVFLGKPLAQENMSQMCTAIIADNFGSHPISILNPFYRSFNFIIKTGPAAMRIELVVRFVKRRVTSFANICSLFFVLIILARKRLFSAFMLLLSKTLLF